MTTLQQDINATLVWPITPQGRRIAHQLAQAHTQTQIADRVRRNCLAVWVVHDFLSALGLATDPASSDSWNPVLHLMEDIADLQLPGLGVLECRSVEPIKTASGVRFEASCPIPSEARLDRDGYVMVALDETAGEATLLGFSAVQEPEEIRLDRLQAMAALPDYLHRLAETEANTVTCLGEWLEGSIEALWQAVEDIIAPQLLQPAFRQVSHTPTEFRRAKRLVLAPTTVVALVVGITMGLGDVAELVMQLSPVDAVLSSPSTAPDYLPEGITLEVIDATGAVVLIARSNATDNALQLSFTGQVGEAFSLRIGWQSAQVTEQFLI